MRYLQFSLFCFLLIAIGCSSKVTTTGATTSGKHTEDLSVLRPKPANIDTVKNSSVVITTDTKRQPTQYVEAKFAVNESLDNVLDSISKINIRNGSVDGFTIQIYSGIKREDALNVKRQFSNSFPDLDAEIQYVQPNYRVRAGKYYDRFKVHKDYLNVRRQFPNAIVIPDKISIN